MTYHRVSFDDGAHEMKIIRDTDQPDEPPVVIGLKPSCNDMIVTMNGVTVLLITECDDNMVKMLSYALAPDTLPMLKRGSDGRSVMMPKRKYTDEEYVNRARALAGRLTSAPTPFTLDAMMLALREGMGDV